jgi:protein Mpv17
MQRPYKIDPVTIAQFLFYTVVNVPINCLWQDWLEDTFPGSTAIPVDEAEAKEKKKAGKPVEVKKAVNIQNILIKFVCDQTIGAAFNIPIFLASIGLAKGQGVDQIVSTIQKVSTSSCDEHVLTDAQDALSIYIAGAKLWPAVSLISFIAIPVERRVIFGSIAGVIWNIYLSLKAG